MAARARTKPKARPTPKVAKRKAPPKASPLTDLGLPSLKIRSGRIDEEWRNRLRGKRKFCVYREMGDSNSTCGGFINNLQVFIGKVPWSVKPPSIDGTTSPEAERIAQRTDGAFKDMEDTPSQMIAEIVKFAARDGSAPMERTYKICRGDYKDSDGRPDPMLTSAYDDGLMAWRSWSIRPLESVDRWLYDAEFRIQAMEQIVEENYTRHTIPIEKLMLFRFRGSKRNPEGDSMFSIVERDYYFLKIFEEIEAIGLKRELAGMPVMQVPPAMMHPLAPPEMKTSLAQYQDLVSLVEQDSLGGLVVPAEEQDGKKTGYKFGLVASGGSRAIDVGAVIKRKRSDMSVGLGAAFMYAGMDGIGARSLDESKQDTFKLQVLSILRSIKETMDTAIQDMMRLWGVARELWPEFEHGPIDEASLTEFSTYISAMLSSGAMTPGDEIDAVSREKIGLAARRDDVGEVDEEAATKEDETPKFSKDELRAMMTRPEVRSALMVGDTAIERMVSSGKLREYSIGGRRKYDPKDVHEMLSQSVRQVDEAAVDRVVEKVAKKRISRDAGIAQMVRFAGVTVEDAEALMGDVGRGWFADQVAA